MINYSNQGVVWYAMKTTYKREMQAKAYLDSRGIDCFIPMEEYTSTKIGRKRVLLKPAIYNLIFVKSDLSQLSDIKGNLSYLRHQLATHDGISAPIIVPTKQMDQFINASQHQRDKITYVDLSATEIAKGTPVRIVDGKFKGYEGVLEKIKGKKDRRVYIKIDGLIAYKFDVEARFVEKI